MSVIKSEYIDAFKAAGLHANEAKVLAYLLEKKEGQSRDIEKTMDLRQPEACNALSSLNKLGWIKKKGVERSTQGRPVYNYILGKKTSQIIKMLKEKVEKEIKYYENIILKLSEVENGHI